MMKDVCAYSTGDWIVHSNYGVGQIRGKEVKCISGQEKRYYKVEATNSTYWIPVDQMDSDLLRPLSSLEEIQEAVATLQKPAEELPSNIKSRQSYIRDMLQRNTPRAIARLIRDLRALRRQKGILNNAESSALRTLLQRFASEWAIVAGVSSDMTMSKLEHLLDPRRSSNGGQVDAALFWKKDNTSSPSKLPGDSSWGNWPKRQTNKINR